MERQGILAAGAVVGLIAAAGVVGGRWWHDRPPYGPGTLSAHATLQLVDQATADAALRPVRTEVAGAGDQIVLGRVSWSRPPHPRPGNSFRIVLLDKREHLRPGFLAASSARPNGVSTGSDSSLDVAQERYPWLRGAGTRKINGSYVSSGSAIFVESVRASPVTFQTVFHRVRAGTTPENRVASAPVAVDDLLVALISVGPDGQVYWAHRVLN